MRACEREMYQPARRASDRIGWRGDMKELEVIVGLILAATLLAAVARRVGAPYPVFLALGGALLAFVPGAPTFTVLPELALALFVAPVLLDAAYDASPRDLRDNWAPVTGLVVVAVGLTTMRSPSWRACCCRRCRGRRRLRSAPSSRRRMPRPLRPCCASCGRRIAS